jgi:hypothetical protein
VTRSGVDLISYAAKHCNKLLGLLVIWVTATTKISRVTIKKFDDIFQDNGHVFSISAATLGNTWWCFQDS